MDYREASESLYKINPELDTPENCQSLVESGDRAPVILEALETLRSSDAKNAVGYRYSGNLAVFMYCMSFIFSMPHSYADQVHFDLLIGAGSDVASVNAGLQTLQNMRLLSPQNLGDIFVAGPDAKYLAGAYVLLNKAGLLNDNEAKLKVKAAGDKACQVAHEIVNQYNQEQDSTMSDNSIKTVKTPVSYMFNASAARQEVPKIVRHVMGLRM